MDRLRYQGLTYFAKRIRDPMDSTYKDLQTVEVKMKYLYCIPLYFSLKLKRKLKRQYFMRTGLRRKR